MQIRHALIMAAGRGQRMMPLTRDIPKPMVKIDGTTLIAKGVESIAQRIENVHVTVGYKKSLLAKHVIELGVRSVLNSEGKGNAWWIFNTLLKNLDEPIYVLTCDNITELDFDLLEKSYLERGSPPCMLVPVRPINGLEGDYIFHKNGIVTQLDRNTPTEIYCSGIQILNPCYVNSLINECEDFGEVWRQLIEMKKLSVSSVYPKKWISIDTVQQLMLARKAS